MRTKAEKKIKYGTAALEREYGALTVSKMLSSYRLGEEMTATAMAKKLGISPQLLCDFEKGRRLVSPGRAFEFGKRLNLMPEHWVEVALRDLLRSEKLDFKVSVA